MDESQLSLRLSTAASYVEQGDRLADIGSDHAYLPCALASNGKVAFAIAGEVVKGPFQAAQNQVNRLGLTKQISVRLGDGLEVLSPADEVSAITICGMGGSLIASILDNGFKKGHLTGKERLILQPNVGELTLRKWLVDHNYMITAEDIIEENDKIYELMVAVKSPTEKFVATASQLTFGFYLKDKNSAIFKKKWQKELEKNQYILASLTKSSVDQTAKIKLIQAEIQEIEEVLK